jgi:hypothetical protein
MATGLAPKAARALAMIATDDSHPAIAISYHNALCQKRITPCSVSGRAIPHGREMSLQ